MSQLSPKQIILHCGLHKTGTTYLQRNLQSNQDALLELGILYLGPTTFKNQCKELWKYIEFGQSKPPIEKIRDQTLTTLMNLAGNKPEKKWRQYFFTFLGNRFGDFPEINYQ